LKPQQKDLTPVLRRRVEPATRSGQGRIAVTIAATKLLPVSKPVSLVYLPKLLTSGVNAKGRFGNQDFVHVAADDVYLCPAGEQLIHHH
jgi:hypothetical protein